jgi:tetratricopeptide (TPR) repeat protein
MEAMGRAEEAVANYQELLRLNPNDNQGVRDLLLPRLILMGRDSAASKLLDQYGEDGGALWGYCRALLAFRAEGDSSAAREAVRRARKTNPHVPRSLLGEDQMPSNIPGSYARGSEEEATICAELTMEAWATTPGAVEWLRGRLKETAKRRSKRLGAKKHKKRRR